MHPERYPLPSQFIESQRVAPGADGECPPTPPAGQDSSGVAAGGRTVRGFARLIGGLGAARVMDFGFYLILARALGVERFGVYTFSVSFVMLAHVLTDMGLSIVLARDVAKSPARIRALLSEAVRLKAALALVTMIAVGAAAGIAGLPRDVLAAVALLTIAMVSNSLAQTFEAILKSAGRAGSAGLSAFAQSTAGLLTGAALIVLGAGVFAGVLAYLVAAVVHVSVAAARSRDLWRGQGAAEAPRQRGRMLREALPLALSGVFIAIYFRIDAVMLQALQGERAVGLYGGVYRLFEALAILSAAARSVLFPLMARAADGPADALRLLCRRSLRLQLMGTIGIAVFLSMQAEPIVLALLGDGFAPAAPALALLACAVPFAFMADLLLAFLIAQGRQSLGTWAVGATASLNVGLNLVLIPRFSIEGAAAATVASEVLSFALLYGFLSRKVPGIGFSSLAWRPIAAGAVLAIALGVFASAATGVWPRLFLGIALAAIVYPLAMSAYGAFDRADFELARRLWPFTSSRRRVEETP
jgi:O-antigen/teichoic acid export membrane protein